MDRGRIDDVPGLLWLVQQCREIDAYERAQARFTKGD
jgi:hypothetical protein